MLTSSTKIRKSVNSGNVWNVSKYIGKAISGKTRRKSFKLFRTRVNKLTWRKVAGNKTKNKNNKSNKKSIRQLRIIKAMKIAISSKKKDKKLSHNKKNSKLKIEIEWCFSKKEKIYELPFIFNYYLICFINYFKF